MAFVSERSAMVKGVAWCGGVAADRASVAGVAAAASGERDPGKHGYPRCGRHALPRGAGELH
jgi:hypothetical protein